MTDRGVRGRVDRTVGIVSRNWTLPGHVAALGMRGSMLRVVLNVA